MGELDGILSTRGIERRVKERLAGGIMRKTCYDTGKFSKGSLYMT